MGQESESAVIAGRNGADTPARRSILMLASPTASFQGLVFALRSRFPTFDAHLVDDLRLVTGLRPRVALVLCQAQTPQDAEQRLEECQTWFPETALALIIDTAAGAMPARPAGKSIQGVLPLDVDLDVWLAAVTVLLSGGEYYPVARHGYEAGAAEPDLPPPMRERHAGLSLTRRERQVLAFISQGLQNKIIADRMSLSEHTVKVHVHNLITKLGVNNRTQAAAFFRAYPRAGTMQPGRLAP